MRLGAQSWMFERKPFLASTATVVGPEEGRGPLGNAFDIVHGDLILEQDSWEKAERMMLAEATKVAIENARTTKEHIEMYIGGDLMNQIITSTFVARSLGIPYLGVFGACSTSMESLALAAALVDGGQAGRVLVGTSSHNCTSEKQFRYPTEYGSQKPPTAQFTVTGAGAAVVTANAEREREIDTQELKHGAKKDANNVIITGATIGKVVDMGIKDPFNMGAAMAPAAVDTIQMHLRDFGVEPGYYDRIYTGDLAQVGYDLAIELFDKHRVPIAQTVYQDCGLMIFDRATQPVQAGGSGCGCSASVVYGPIVAKLRSGELRRVLVVATGALLSPLSFQQGESIPCIAHAVVLEAEEVSGHVD